MKIRQISPELAEIAAKELNEKPNQVLDDIIFIKDWISQQPYLKARTDDQWILSFLRGSKFSLERAKQKIDLYYTIRTLVPEMCRINNKSERFLEVYKYGFALPLLKSKPGAPGTMIISPGAVDISKYSVIDAMTVFCAVTEMVIRDEDQYSIAGVNYICDLRNATMMHFVPCTPPVLKKMVKIFQEANPIRLKGIHYLYPPTGFETIMMIIKGLLPVKIRSRIFIHSKMETLHECFSKDVLPKELGGSCGTIQDLKDHWLKRLEGNDEWFSKDPELGTIESKRPGKAKTMDNIFGIEGSFRQLTVD